MGWHMSGEAEHLQHEWDTADFAYPTGFINFNSQGLPTLICFRLHVWQLKHRMTMSKAWSTSKREVTLGQ